LPVAQGRIGPEFCKRFRYDGDIEVIAASAIRVHRHAVWPPRALPCVDTEGRLIRPNLSDDDLQRQKRVLCDQTARWLRGQDVVVVKSAVT
jgi:hypothetical protein